jgi:Family of unknown function (DUF5941)
MNERDLLVYRDDGPLAHALGLAAAPLRLPPLALIAAGALPLAVGAAGADLSRPAVIAWLVVIAGLSGGRVGAGRLRWTVPPALRAAEYGGLLWLAGTDGAGAAFALLAVTALHQYDLVYRLRDRGRTPPGWLIVVTGGWDGRLLLACVLQLGGMLRPGLLAVAGLLAALTIAESFSSWRRAETAA